MVSREDVARAYDALLGRAPESEAAMQFQAGHASFADLCVSMASSPEFRARYEAGLATGAASAAQEPAVGKPWGRRIGALRRRRRAPSLPVAEIEATYRALFGRAPEPDEVAEAQVDDASFTALCARLIASPAFAQRMADDRRAFDLDRLDEAVAAFHGGDKATFAGMSMRLPPWYDVTLDPAGGAYRAQVLRLWEEITLRSAYSAALNEDTPEVAGADVRRPGFFATGDAAIAGNHLIALGHILLRSGIGAGAVALEYGAGWGQIALAFAQTGVEVHTVDINPHFCDLVRRGGAHNGVSLTAHVGEFGFNPLGRDGAYDLIYFYESFHHCLDFHALLPRLGAMLKPGGRILMAGEPVFPAPEAAMPYPWGIRLDWENVAIMRIRGWMELGWQKEYLLGQFAEAGFDCDFHDDPNSHWARVYVLRRRPDVAGAGAAG